MKKNKRILMLILACVLTIAGTVMAVAAIEDDFKVIVDTDKNTYSEGEDINMSVKIENSSDLNIEGVKLTYNIPEDIQDNIVNYDKLPATLDSLDEDVTVIFSTITGNTDTGVADTVMLFVGIMLVAAAMVIVIKTGIFKKFASVFMVVVMVVSLSGYLSATVEATTESIDIKGSKTIEYDGEEKSIEVCATIFLDSVEGEDSTDSTADIGGTDLAKLLLANDRLDADKLTEDSDLFLTADISELNYITLSTVDTSNYDENSNMMDYFNSYIEAVNSVTESAASTITYIKENVSYTGVWIEYGAVAGEVLLEVTDNEEVLFINADVNEFVCRRYTDENGQDVYEICQTEKADGSHAYLRCIPNKLYEYSFYWADGNDIHVIAENSRGYWNMFTTYLVEEGKRNVQNLVSTDDYGYVYFGTIDEEGYKSNNQTTFIDASLSCDLISIYEERMDIKLVGFNGIESMEIDENNFITSFTTAGGDVIELDDEIAEGIIYKMGDVAYSDVPYATLTFKKSDVMCEEDAAAIIEALADLGVTCKYDLTDVLAGVDASYAIADNLGSYYSWNGYYVSDYANVQSAVEVELDKYAELVDAYEVALDAEKIEESSTGVNFADYDFAQLTLSGAEAVTLDDAVVTISGLEAKVDVAEVMMDGETYEIQFALAGLSDVEGEYTSAILLTTVSDGVAKYTGEALELTKSAEVVIPQCTQTGDYTLVAYVATSEGIRVSDMVPLVFTASGEYKDVVNGYETLIELNDAGEMVVYYTPKNEYEATMPEQDSYTYEDVYAFLSTEAMKYGYPNTEAVLEVYDATTGEVIEATEGDTLSGCICKLQYDIPNADGLLAGYVYVSIQ